MLPDAPHKLPELLSGCFQIVSIHLELVHNITQPNKALSIAIHYFIRPNDDLREHIKPETVETTKIQLTGTHLAVFVKHAKLKQQ